VVIGSGITLFFILSVAHYGLVSGEEFSPHTFERRTYHYYELPLVRLKITPLVRQVQRHQLETLLINKKYLTTQSPPQRWDLIAATRGGEPWRTGNAQILAHYLDAWDNANNMTSYWETWTVDHPGLAKVVWPEIARLARRELYVLMPPLFDLALAHERPAELQSDLNRTLARNYERLAEAKVELGDYRSAARFYEQALEHDPGRQSSIRGRRACKERLGEDAEPSGKGESARPERKQPGEPSSSQEVGASVLPSHHSAAAGPERHG
jgi:tetratricopeptide (TPR) repeat protein